MVNVFSIRSLLQHKSVQFNTLKQYSNIINELSSKEVASLSVEDKFSHVLKSYPFQAIQILLSTVIFLSLVLKNIKSFPTGMKNTFVSYVGIGVALLALVDISADFQPIQPFDPSFDNMEISKQVFLDIHSLLHSLPSLKLMYIVLQVLLFGKSFGSLLSSLYFLLPYLALAVMITITLLSPMTGVQFCLPLFPQESTNHTASDETANHTAPAVHATTVQYSPLQHSWLLCSSVGLLQEFHELVRSIQSYSKVRFSSLLLLLVFFLLENYLYTTILHHYHAFQASSFKQLLTNGYASLSSLLDVHKKKKKKYNTAWLHPKRHRKKTNKKHTKKIQHKEEEEDDDDDEVRVFVAEEPATTAVGEEGHANANVDTNANSSSSDSDASNDSHSYHSDGDDHDADDEKEVGDDVDVDVSESFSLRNLLDNDDNDNDADLAVNDEDDTDNDTDDHKDEEEEEWEGDEQEEEPVDEEQEGHDEDNDNDLAQDEANVDNDDADDDQEQEEQQEGDEEEEE